MSENKKRPTYRSYLRALVLDAPRTAEAESEFRADNLELDKSQLFRFSLLTLMLVVLYGAAELLSLPRGEGKLYMLLARCLGFASSLASLLLLRRVRTWPRLEALTLVCLSGVVLHLETSRLFRPGFGFDYVAWDALIIFIVFMALPMRMTLKVGVCLALSFCSMGILAVREDVDFFEFESFGVLVVYSVANLFGLVSGVHAHRYALEGHSQLARERRLKAELEIAIDGRNRLYRALAHDLRGSVGSLVAISDMLDEAERQGHASRAELATMVRDGSKASYELLESMLEWCATESDEIVPEPGRVRLREAIERSVGLFEGLARKKGIRIRIESDGSEYVWVDSRLIDSVLRNLVSNALKFTSQGGQVSVAIDAHGSGQAKVTVSDNGVGIDAERLDRLFDLESDENTLGTSGEKGANLGLRICSECVSRFGGRIWASSVVGSGTTFHFTVPLDDGGSQR